jgi:broad specificity phosphatase PhoE
MTRIYLLRHGATASNRVVPYRLQGRRSDEPLDELGIDQARRAADILANVAIDAVYTSPLIRACETATIVGQSHGLVPISIPELTEAELGRWEGLTWEQARVRDPDLHEKFMAETGTVPYPGGESFLDVQRRTSPAMSELAGRHPGGKLIVVGHNVVNRAYLAGVLGIPIARARAIRQANCGVNIIEYEDAVPVVICLNACLHLEA